MNNVVSALRRSFRRRGGAAAKKRQETRQKQQEQDETTATTRTSREDLLDCEDEVGVIRREREKEEREREMRRRALKAAKSEADMLTVETASEDGAEAAEVAGAKSEMNLLTAQDIVGDEEEEKKAEEEERKVEMEKEEKEEDVHNRSDRGRTSLIGCLCFEEEKHWQVFFLLDEAGCFVSVFPSFFPQNHFPSYSPSFPPTL